MNLPVFLTNKCPMPFGRIIHGSSIIVMENSHLRLIAVL